MPNTRDGPYLRTVSRAITTLVIVYQDSKQITLLYATETGDTATLPALSLLALIVIPNNEAITMAIL
jgi:hypothetical protein